MRDDQDIIAGWGSAHGLVEFHSYAAGKAGAIAPHMHETFQICYSCNVDGAYVYRGRERFVPARGLSVLAPGEVHAARDVADRAHRSDFVTLYPTARHVDEALARLGHREPSRPPLQRLLDLPVLGGGNLAGGKLGAAVRDVACDALLREPLLRQQASFDRLVGMLVEQSGETLVVAPQLCVRGALRGRMQTARDAIVHAPARDWSVDELAKLSHQSTAHFAQLFSRVVGLPPHRFLMQQRVELARTLLAQGASVHEAARKAGFADQSHLSRWFQRYVQISPGRYCLHNRRNVLISHLRSLEMS